jgi:hypothetical protein
MIVVTEGRARNTSTSVEERGDGLECYHRACYIEAGGEDLRLE